MYTVPSDLECKEPRITGRTIPEVTGAPNGRVTWVKSVKKWRMKWVRPHPPKGRQLPSEEDADADAKALRRRINPAGCTATRHLDELVELARDKEEWEGTANAIYPAKRLTTAVLSREIRTPRSWAASRSVLPGLRLDFKGIFQHAHLARLVCPMASFCVLLAFRGDISGDRCRLEALDSSEQQAGVLKD